jgi:hypothetical protein
VGIVDDFLSDQSKRLHDSYAEERPAEPSKDAEDSLAVRPATPEEMAEAEAYVLRRVLDPVTVAVVLLDDDPHVQIFRCSQGHFLGSVTLLQCVVLLRVGGKAQCVVCGETRATPRYEPVGDEPEYILTALKEHTNGEAPEAE